ncbi:avidin [Janthinobacterium sp. BJB301]|uniref:avidin/streptavidin family protein n=1 Tax=Janthinobacterium sp. BJB301 TaxID=1560195 RepID=UPI000C1046BC|nr:avidin/streptavidin family protein [Janthinobacterium sp. BJB301]PHV51370.1 avidin [Janthinobacterium sp. BJB301]
MSHELALTTAVSTENNNVNNSVWIGHWKNQMGSTMELQLNGSDLSGTYVSSSSSAGGPIKGPLKGYAAGDRAAFVVMWPGGSITTWAGQIVNDQKNPTIKTLWHLVTDVPDADEPTKFWQSTLAGADEFTR